jgi:hypothetical protein
MKNLIEMLQAIFGKKIISGTIGTRTNVIKLPSNKSNPRLKEFDVFRSSENPAVLEKLKKVIEDEAPYIAQMNDKERLIYEGNVKRLHDYLITTGEIKPAISAEVVGLGTKEPISGKGLESLLEQSGQVSPPGTLIGDIQSRINKLKGLGKEMEKQTGEKADIGDILKDLGASQQSMSRLNDEGLVRAAARQILINDIKAGKIKNITVSEAINMGEPLDPFRQIYGEGALEQLDSLIPNLRGLKTEVEAEKLARSKFKFEPDENRLPGSTSIEEGRKAEQEFGINKPVKEVETESKGLDYLAGTESKKKPEVINLKTAVDKRKSVDDLIDEYNANQDRLLLTDDEGGTLITYPEYNRLKDRNEEIAKVLEEKGIKSTPEVETQPEGQVIPFKKKPEEFAEGGRIGFRFGSGKKIINKLTKKTKKPTKEDYEDYGEILNDSENTVVQGTETFEELEALVKKQKDYEAYMYQQYKSGKLDPVAGEKSENRLNFLRRKADEAEMTKDNRLISIDEIQELEDLERTFNPSTINISDPKVAESFTNFARENDPEGFKKIQKIVDDINNRNTLEGFDVKDRKPNSKGGLNYLMGL